MDEDGSRGAAKDLRAVDVNEIFLNFTADERHRREETQRFFDHPFQIFQFVEIVHRARTGAVTRKHPIDLLVQFLLHFRMRRDGVASEVHRCSRGVVALPSENEVRTERETGVDLLRT